MMSMMSNKFTIITLIVIFIILTILKKSILIFSLFPEMMIIMQ